jgi:hypothetical protein
MQSMLYAEQTLSLQVTEPLEMCEGHEAIWATVVRTGETSKNRVKNDHFWGNFGPFRGRIEGKALFFWVFVYWLVHGLR